MVGCDGSVREVIYPAYTNGTDTRWGPISGVSVRSFPVPIWRTRSNRGADLAKRRLGADGSL